MMSQLCQAIQGNIYVGTTILILFFAIFLYILWYATSMTVNDVEMVEKLPLE